MRYHVELAGLLDAQRDSRAVEANLERVAAQRPAHEGELGPFDEAQYHQALDGGIGGIDRVDTGRFTRFEIR
jgi:hypothetical protein